MNKETRDLLKMRAIAMAREPEQAVGDSENIEVVAFTLATETYGIESAYVAEVYPLKDLTPLPSVPSHIVGIISVRGQITAVVDLKKFFNLPVPGIGEFNKVIIVRDAFMEFGILADSILGTYSVSVEAIRPAPATVSGIGEEYLKGVTNENLIILNAPKLLSDKRIVVHEEVN